MKKISTIIAEETKGKSFKTRKYFHLVESSASISYDDNTEIEWKEHGETERIKEPRCLKVFADQIRYQSVPSIFTYFLDGSRHTYKVDDISYKNKVYPVIAGQIGVGCCVRKNKRLHKEVYKRENVIVLPDKSFSSKDSWYENETQEKLINLINKSTDNGKYPLYFDHLFSYKTHEMKDPENSGIAKIQDRMMELEREMVNELVKARKLNHEHYLIKDGTIDYQRMTISRKNGSIIDPRKLLNNYRYVLGVSKSFNPTKCKDKNGKSNSDFIATLKPFERTPAYMYESTRAGQGVFFCIWYLRIRDARYTQNVFDGILKVEKLLITDDEKRNGLSSELIDTLSAHLLNERTPTCYGKDMRWANHIYPVYLTEEYIKSKYMSESMFLQQF